MFTITIKAEMFQTLIDALEIAASWHKHDKKFTEALKFLCQIKTTT